MEIQRFLIKPEDALVVIIDVQEKLVKVMEEKFLKNIKEYCYAY